MGRGPRGHLRLFGTRAVPRLVLKLSGMLSLSPCCDPPLVPPRATLASPVLVAWVWWVLLAENSRIPIDDPNTHLELTMIHEVVLDQRPAVWIILYGAAVKLFVLSAVVLHVLVPVKAGWATADWALFVLEMLGVAAAIGVVESVMARLQLRHVPTLLVAASLLCAFGFLLMLR
jgi:formate hydrogenlyase subunit 4